MSKYNTSYSFKDTIPGDALIIETCPTLQASDSNISGSKKSLKQLGNTKIPLRTFCFEF